MSPELTALENEVARDPGSALARLRFGTALLRAGRASRAERVLREAVSLDPSCAGAWVNLGGVLMARWDFAAAVEANRRALAADPALVAARFNEGLGHLYLGEAGEMLACFEEVVARTPGDGAAFYYLGVALHALGRTAEARVAVAYAGELGYAVEPELLRALEASEPGDGDGAPPDPIREGKP